MLSVQARRLKSFWVLAMLSGLLAACASNDDLPAVTEEGLQRVDARYVDAAYRDPDADFSQYEKLYIADVRVAFKKDWLEDVNRDRRSVSHRVTQEDADRIKAAIAADFKAIFTEELEKGGYAVLQDKSEAAPSDDILVLIPAIVDLYVTAPDTMTAGRSRTYTTEAGSMTLYMEFYDSVTGALLGRVTDAQTARDTGHMQVSNSVTNKAEADRIMRKWARLLVDRLDQVNGR